MHKSSVMGVQTHVPICTVVDLIADQSQETEKIRINDSRRKEYCRTEVSAVNSSWRENTTMPRNSGIGYRIEYGA